MAITTNGYGEYSFPDGRVYKGDWKDSKIQGAGVMHFPDGRMYKGQWCAGVPCLSEADHCFGLDIVSPVDLNAPLDARDVELVQKTWARTASLGAATVGKVVFQHVFALAPEAIALFPFKDVPKDKLYLPGGDLEKYGTRIVMTFDTGIKNLGDLGIVVPILKEHVPPLFPGAAKEHYGIIGQAIVNSLFFANGPVFTDAVKNSWLKVWTTIVSVLFP
jgi:hypothetical protein